MTKWSNPECETRILIKLFINDIYLSLFFLMWVSPLVHDAIQMTYTVSCTVIKSNDLGGVLGRVGLVSYRIFRYLPPDEVVARWWWLLASRRMSGLTARRPFIHICFRSRTRGWISLIKVCRGFKKNTYSNGRPSAIISSNIPDFWPHYCTHIP